MNSILLFGVMPMLFNLETGVGLLESFLQPCRGLDTVSHSYLLPNFPCLKDFADVAIAWDGF